MVTGDYQIDEKINFFPNKYIISAAHHVIKLSEKETMVLLALCRAYPAVVTRQILIKDIWSDASGADRNLNKCVLLIRRKMESLGAPLDSISTVPRVGYLMALSLTVLPVEVDNYMPLVLEANDAQPTARFYPLKKMRFMSMLVAMICAVSISILWYRQTTRMPPIASTSGSVGKLFYTLDINTKLSQELVHVLDKKITLGLEKGGRYYGLISPSAISIVLVTNEGEKNETILYRREGETLLTQLNCATKSALEHSIRKSKNTREMFNSAYEGVEVLFFNSCVTSDGFVVNVHQIANRSTEQVVQRYVISDQNYNPVMSFSRAAIISRDKRGLVTFDYSRTAVNLKLNAATAHSAIVNRIIFDITPAVMRQTSLNYEDGVYYTDLLGGALYYTE